MSRNRFIGALYFLGAALFGIPGAVLIGAVMLYNLVYEAEACSGIYWCDHNAYGFLGLIPLTVAYWLGDRGLDYWRRDE